MIEVNGYKTYPGGKSGDGTYQQIINKIPPHEIYMSLFLGLCGVTRRIQPAKVGVLCDMDRDLVASWNSAILPAGYQVVQGDAIKLLANIAEIGDGRCVPARIAELIDSPVTFLFLDPPYLVDTRKSMQALYKHEMTRIDHEFLLAAVLKLKHAKVMLCAYPNPLYDELLKGWVTYTFLSKTRNGMAKECLYMNYLPTDVLHDYSYIGANFREREKITRIKNNFLAKLERLEPKVRNSILSDLASHVS